MYSNASSEVIPTGIPNNNWNSGTCLRMMCRPTGMCTFRNSSYHQSCTFLAIFRYASTSSNSPHFMARTNKPTPWKSSKSTLNVAWLPWLSPVDITANFLSRSWTFRPCPSRKHLWIPPDLVVVHLQSSEVEFFFPNICCFSLLIDLYSQSGQWWASFLDNVGLSNYYIKMI